MKLFKRIITNMLHRLLFTILGLIIIYTASYAQIGTGQWREHLPYSQAIDVAEDESGIIYAATPYSIFYLQKSDYSLSRMSSITGLSDVGVSSIEFSNDKKTLIIGYENGNLDFVKNGIINNISDIKRKSIIGSKRINDIYLHDDLAYLSCGFGVVVFDLSRMEIKDSYFIGDLGATTVVNSILIVDTNIYASTTKGVKRANVNGLNLSSYESWSTESQLGTNNFGDLTNYKGKVVTFKKSDDFAKDTLFMLENGVWTRLMTNLNGPFTNVAAFGDTLVVASEWGFHYFYNNLNSNFIAFTYNQPDDNTLPTPNKIIQAADGELWIADDTRGLVRMLREWLYEKYIPTGPKYNSVWKTNLIDGSLWVVSGGIAENSSGMYSTKGIYNFKDGNWKSYNNLNTSAFDSLLDPVSVAIDPSNVNHVFVGTWGGGLMEFQNGEVVNVFDEKNSILNQASNNPGWVAIEGLEFDDENNLWITNSSNKNALLKLSSSGQWKEYNLSPSVNEEFVGDLAIDDFGQKWIILRSAGGMVVFSENGTPDDLTDDKKTRITASTGAGHLPSTLVNAVEKDLDGEIWVGTSKGIAVFYSPELVFSGYNFDAQQIYVNPFYLLETENVTAIAIDGANRKWLGTQNAGVFLMSDDGTEEIHHFTSENSPLLSNHIYSISIDGQSGEVFFGTSKGLISYRSDATTGKEYHSDINVFPNPVKPEYNGLVTISGLVTDAEIRITDATGNLVLETKAEGGTATWNCKNYYGERVGSGVYLVFSSNEDGSETTVAKILIIN